MEETNVESGPVDRKFADEEMVEAEHQPPSSSVPQPKAASDSDSSSDSDDDSGDEAKETLQIETLEAELASIPTNYEAHVEYIRALRKKGEIEKLRQAREAMNELFPLSPGMWQEWAKDEISLISGPESLSAIEKLYERGIFDYLSIPLWCDYLLFVKEHDPAVREYSPLGTSKARSLFERALTFGGLHVKEGSKIWEAYREFELDILKNIDGAHAEAREKQIQLIRNLFHRQLSVPHGDLRLTLLAYKSWEVEQGSTIDANSSGLDGIPSNVASSYQKALEMLDARAHLEEQISKPDLSDEERLQEYMVYLKFEQSSGDPARVQILYERAVTEFPISNDLWLDYTSYLDKTLKAASIVRDVYSRATRNCPWVGELWVRYLLSIERGRGSEEEIATVFEKALLCTFLSFDEYLDIFLTRIDGLRRRISQSDLSEDSLDMALMRETFQRALDYLSPDLKGTDSLLRLHSYWARLESDLGRSIVAARGVWESFLKTSGSMLEAWQGYISMEVGMKNINEARSLYRRSYSKRFPGTGSEDICYSWLRFEREFGTLEDLDHALHKVTPRLRELQYFRLQEESKNTNAVANQMDTSTKKVAREKRKQGSDTANEQPKPKRQKDRAANARKAQREDKPQEERSVHTNKGENVHSNDSRSSRAQGSEHRESSPVKQKFSDQCTVFMSNLSVRATADDLHRFFSDVGGVVAVRILKDKYTGKSRGLAYVDFSDDAHLTAAVAKNRQMFLGKRLSIARSDPKKQRPREAVGRNPPADHGQPNGQSSADGESESAPKDSSDSQKASAGSPEESAPRQRGNSNVQLKGKNTFAVPRAVKPLGWSARNQPKVKRADEGEEDQKPKSNDEFRNMLLKK